jgi:sugar lactone lactonase YvrE
MTDSLFLITLNNAQDVKKTLITVLLFFTGFSFPAFNQLIKVWENDTDFKGPESIVYDKTSHCLYVSNYNRNPKNGENYNADCISKVDLNGELIEKEFAGNLTCPTGLSIFNGKLYIVERFGIVQFDIGTGQVETRYRINGPGFLNDIAVDADGYIYVTVSDKQSIYRISNGIVEKWLESNELAGINGIIVDGSKLIAGVTGDSCLKSIALADKKIEIVARFHSGIIDGVKKYGNDYLVSHFEGNIYLVKNDGKVIELLNTREQKGYCADFEFVEDQGVFVIPSLWNNSIVCYKFNP